MSIHKECPACHTSQSEIDQTFEELGIDLNDLLPCVCSDDRDSTTTSA